MLSSRLPLLISLGLVVLTLAAYGQLWDNDFIDLDDVLFITQNPPVLGGLSFQNIKWAWETKRGGSQIPLTWMSLQLDASVADYLEGLTGRSQLLAVVCHGQNLLWHTGTVVLLFVVLRRMTEALWRSALVAALFAVHPLHVESVAWATERKDVLSTFFWVLSLLLYARYVERPGIGRYLLVAASFVLGLLAKPMLVTLPCTLLLLDFWPLGRFPKPLPPPLPEAKRGEKNQVILSFSPSPFRGGGWGEGFWNLVLEKVPLFVIAAAASVLVFQSQQQEGALQEMTAYSLSARVANAVQSYGWYLEKTVWPTGLAVYYCHPKDQWEWAPVLLSGGGLVTLTVAAVVLARKTPWLLVGWLWFVGTLLPVIGLIQVGSQVRADRYIYVPHIGLLVALVWSATALLQRLRLPAAMQAALAVGCLLVLTLLNWAQVGYWRDGETLWTQTLAATTRNHMAHHCLGQILFHRALAGNDFAMLEQARQHYQQAVEFDPDFGFYQNNLGWILLRQGSLAEAERHFKQAIQNAAHEHRPWVGLAAAQRLQRKYAEAIPSLQRALELKPEAGTQTELALCLWHLHRHEDAEQQLQAARQLNPTEPIALYGMGLVRLRQGQPRAALELFGETGFDAAQPGRAWSERGLAQARLGEWEQALLSQSKALQEEQQFHKGSGGDPVELSCYHRRRAHALHALDRAAEAKREYAEALRLDPSWPGSNLDQAWTLATSANPAQRDLVTARELAEQVCQALESPTVEALDVLAAAQAALGRYSEAATTARQAIARATGEKLPAIRQRLQLYEKGQPFVAPAQTNGTAP